MANIPKPIPEEVQAWWSADPSTGVISWREVLPQKGRGWVREGQPVRTKVLLAPSGRPYAYIRFRKKHFLLHRVVWFLCTGEQPPDMLDHRNCDALDNRMANLRPATRSQNTANSPPRARGQADMPKGVVRTPAGRFMASITVNRKQTHLGTFDRVDEARNAYVAAAERLFGEFARVE